MSSVQSQIQQDWNNREFVEVIASSIKKIAEFLNAFDLSARSRLALLNQKLTHLERQVEYIEARVTKWTVHFRLNKNVPWAIYARCWACYIDYMKAFYSMYTICCSDSVAQYCMFMPKMMNTSLISSMPHLTVHTWQSVLRMIGVCRMREGGVYQVVKNFRWAKFLGKKISQISTTQAIPVWVFVR